MSMLESVDRGTAWECSRSLATPPAGEGKGAEGGQGEPSYHSPAGKRNIWIFYELSLLSHHLNSICDVSIYIMTLVLHYNQVASG